MNEGSHMELRGECNFISDCIVSLHLDVTFDTWRRVVGVEGNLLLDELLKDTYK